MLNSISKDTIIYVNHLTSTAWAQKGTNDLPNNCEGYNYYVSESSTTCGLCYNRCTVGCGATAMAQILRYWNFASVNNYNIFDWSNMIDTLL